MNWPNIFVLAVGALFVLFALLRVERRRLWVAGLFLALPAVVLMLVWASWRGQWAELGIAGATAGVIAGGWWLIVGRKLPAPTSDNIKVWGQESGPRPKPQELQAEINRLRSEKEQLEAELRRLKGNGQHEESSTD
jgi:hypothetical protein